MNKLLRLVDLQFLFVSSLELVKNCHELRLNPLKALARSRNIFWKYVKLFRVVCVTQDSQIENQKNYHTRGGLPRPTASFEYIFSEKSIAKFEDANRIYYKCLRSHLVWYKISSLLQRRWHFYRTIQSSRYLNKELKDVIDAVIQRNEFFGHHENILLGMISVKRVQIRKLELRRILKVRNLSLSDASFKKIKLSSLNFKSKRLLWAYQLIKMWANRTTYYIPNSQ